MNARRSACALAAALLAGTCLARAADAADPFRALENATDPATQAYFHGEAARARRALDRIAGRAKLLARIRSLSEADTRVTDVALVAGRVFYLRLAPSRKVAVLCMREGFAGAERVLLDPERLSQGVEQASIDWFMPSPDARHVAYGVSRGGREDSLLRVLAVDGGRDLPFEIDRARYNEHLGWQPDGHAFYYARVAEAVAGAGPGTGIHIYRHVLGRETARDEIVFAPGVGGARDVPPDAHPWLVVPPGSRSAYAVAREGVGRSLTVYVTGQKELAAARPRWRKLVAPADEVIAVEAWKEELYLLSHRGAPRRRVLRVTAAAHDLAGAKVVVPQGDSVIEGMALASDALYLHTMVAGVDRLERAELGLLGAKTPQFLRTPFDTAIAQLLADPRHPGAILRLDGWIASPAVVEVDARSGDLRDTGIETAPLADFSAMDEVRLYPAAPDGTRIPVTLLYRKTTRLTGDNPTLLTGYGSYGVTMAPRFDPARLAWLERGGVLAMAHVRGGGEYGEDWHEAGRGAAKANTVGDFIAVAKFLVSYGFTGPRHLAVMGSGAGAIPVGGAFLRDPDLFAAVVVRDPLMDLPGLESMPGGAAYVPEFGSEATPQGRAALRAISPYQQVKDATAYPAVLLVDGANDPSVPAWQAGKMAARLRAANPHGKPVLLRVDFNAGASESRSQHDEELADIYSFVLWQFGDPGFQPPAPPPAPIPAAPPPPPPLPPRAAEPPAGPVPEPALEGQ